MERQYPLGRRDGSVGLVTAYVLDLDPTSPAVVKARPRFQRLRSPRADRVECLRPEEVARVAEGIEADPGLLAQMVARDRSRSPALEEAITRRAADLKARSIAAERVLDAPLAPLALELGRLSADAGDPAWLASVAWPPPSHGAAVAAVEALATLRILRRGADGRLTSVARNGLRLARRHDTTPVDERLRAIHLGASDTIAASCAAPGEAPPFFLRSSRVRLNPEGIALARRRLVAALQALNSDAERTGPWDRVVQLHAFAFPEAPLG